MSEYLSKDIALGIQGVAIKSGAAKKLEQDREALVDIMRRSMPPSVKTTVKTRQEMPSGFKIGNVGPHSRQGPFDVSADQGSRTGSLINRLSKQEIYARMGIDGTKELEIDWEQVDHLGTAKTRIELADKMFTVLEREKEKVEHKRSVFENKLQIAEKRLQEHRMHEQKLNSSGTTPPALGISGSQRGHGADPRSYKSNSNRASPANRSRGSYNGRDSIPLNETQIKNGFFESMKHGQQPWTHLSKDRAMYATKYGINPGHLPYEDEVDMMHEDYDRYQEINHWYSSLEKPTEDNLDVLKRLNHDRLTQLGQMFMEHKLRENAQPLGEEIQMTTSELQNKFLQRSNREVNKEKQEYKDRFKKYLHNKEKMKDHQRSPSPQNSRVDFDRYQCTSPNPKYVDKYNIVPYKDNM